MERTTVYVDGFNFYYGLKRQKVIDRDWRKFYWIDFVKLFEHFLGENQILQKVVYFTASPLNIQKSSRQSALLSANKLLNGNRFEIIKGRYYDKQVICPYCQTAISKPEEKRTDVNISVQIMGDCALNKTDTIVLVSADSDLVPPLEFIKKHFPCKKIKIYFPPNGFSSDLNNFLKNNKGKVVKLRAGGTLSHTVPNLSTGQPYYYALTSLNSGGEKLSIAVGNFSTPFTTDIEEVVPAAQNALTLYPNPVRRGETLYISGAQGKTAVSLIALNGSVLRSEVFEPVSGEIALSTGEIPAGVYLVRIVSKEETKTVRVVVTGL